MAADEDATSLAFAFEFWIAMTALLGSRWVTKHGEEPTEEWIRLLARFAHLNPREVAANIVRQLKPNGRGEVWPPEMADVIVMLTPKPEDFGLPAVGDAYRDAAHRRWGRHPVVYETARRVGVFELRTEPRTRQAFEAEYAEVCAEWMAGARFEGPTPPARQLEHNLMPAWMGRYPSVGRFDFNALKRSLGPMPAPLQPDTPPPPVNDEDFQARQAEAKQALASVASRYQGRGA